MKNWQQVSLRDNDREGIEKAVKKLINAYPIKNIILFGSKARGESDYNSDIDLLIITSRQLGWKEEKAVVELLFDIGIELDIIFTPLFTYLHEWEHGLFKEFPIYQEIQSDGIIIH